MGLFPNPKKDLRQALVAMFNSTSIRHIDRVLDGLTEEAGRFAHDLDRDIEAAAGHARTLAAKGKRGVALDVLREFRAKDPPQIVGIFRAETTAAGAFESAAQTAADQEAARSTTEVAAADAAHEEKRQQWQRVLDEVELRAGVDG
jgi:hypothetical protein